MRKLGQHLSVWINLQDMIVNEKASCKIRYIYGIMPFMYIFKNKNNVLLTDVCTHSRSVKTCIGNIHTVFGVAEERNRDWAKGGEC